MGCSCRVSNMNYVWTSDDGKTTMKYTHEVVAKAKVARSGGTYEKRPKA